MKTVGNVEQDRNRGVDEITSSIPNIDFGPTMNLNSNRAPRQQSPARRASPGPAQMYDTNQRYVSPHRVPVPGFGQSSRPQSAGHSRSPSRPVITPEGGHYRTDSGESRSVAWQPGMGAAIGNSGFGKQQAITTEQFVQQRAAVPPQYATHQRHSSGYTLRNQTPTPPLVQNRSSDFLPQQGSHSRRGSGDLLQRPSSRGATVALGPLGSGDIPTTLTAREQEHIARVTGQPLINHANNTNRPVSTGLVGAIQARETEKERMKQGINSQAVQNAITQRQQQAMYQDYRAPQQQYGNMNMGGQYPQAQYSSPGQQSWVSPAANVYAQGGGFSAPSPGSIYPGTPEVGQQQTPPGVPFSPPQQYFPAQQRPQIGGQGRGQSYQGHQY